MMRDVPKLYTDNSDNETTQNPADVTETEEAAASRLPQLLSDELKNSDDFYRMAFRFQQIMMIYEGAIKQIVTKLEIVNKEYKVSGRRNPIETIKSRIKSPDSIAAKLEKRGLPVNFASMAANLSDIAGVRVICPYISDIYTVRDILLKQPDLKLIEEKDYIAEPKPSGYRSLHLILDTPVYLSQTKQNVLVEVQLRTIAMDFWASLEHELRYKTSSKVPESIRRELYHCAETIAMTDREMEEIAIELQALD